MKDNKSQLASNLLNEELVIATSNLARVVPLNNTRYESSRQFPLQVMDQNTTIVRRHSFDDNGGGYEGL